MLINILYLQIQHDDSLLNIQLHEIIADDKGHTPAACVQNLDCRLTAGLHVGKI